MLRMTTVGLAFAVFVISGCSTGPCDDCAADESCVAGDDGNRSCVHLCELACAGFGCGTTGATTEAGDVLSCPCGTCSQDEVCASQTAGAGTSSGGICVAPATACGPPSASPEAIPVVCGEGTGCVEGECVACNEVCDVLECGPSPCGGDCGVCDGSRDECVDGSCVCQPDCEGKECGDDGCGGSCGCCCTGCYGWECAYSPDCKGKECGSDGLFGYCRNGEAMYDCNSCEAPPFPENFNWGCPEHLSCNLSQHRCVDCDADDLCGDRECGDDGCGGVCGVCPPGVLCIFDAGVCSCQPGCDDKECGPDDCGGFCGNGYPEQQGCEDGYSCLDGECVEQ
jgi:hypothetical protein